MLTRGRTTTAINRCSDSPGLPRSLATFDRMDERFTKLLSDRFNENINHSVATQAGAKNDVVLGSRIVADDPRPA